MSRPTFHPEQVERLLRPIRPGRVYVQQGHSHVAGWDIAAHLTRMFGFGGWEKHIKALDLVFEDRADKGGKDRWSVTYRCEMRLRVYVDGSLAWESDDGATGSAHNQPSRGDAHDLAMKNAVTYALKRCAKDLGDQFGLSLYRKGSMEPVVGMTLVAAEGLFARDVREPELIVDGDECDDRDTAEPVDGITLGADS